MKILYLLRHAKSAWDDPDMPDHDRPLAPRGARAATLVGRYLREHGVDPDLMLCSTARRAADTLRLVAAALDSAGPRIDYDPSLYLKGDRAMLDRLRRLPGDVDTVLLVAHNPDIRNLALCLAGTGASGLIDRIASGYPTAALTKLSFDLKDWWDLGAGKGRIDEFVIPKDLPETRNSIFTRD